MKPHKKSETLEVRLSYPDKIALKNKAAREGRTVSDVVRGLITSYIAKTEPRSKSSNFMELVIMLKSKPKSVMATLACLPILVTPFLLPATANAGDISLTLESEYTESTKESSHGRHSVRREKTEVRIAEGQFFSLPVAPSPPLNPNAQLHMSLRASEGSNQIVTMEIVVCEKTDVSENAIVLSQVLSIDSCEGEKMIANPKITAKYGETAEFRMETEYPIENMKNGKPADFTFKDDNRKGFKLLVSPKKL